MARTLPAAVVQALTAESTGEVFLCLLHVSHADWGDLRFVNNTESVTSNGNVFSPAPFSVVLPPDTPGVAPRLTVRMANAARDLVAEVRAVAGGPDRIAASLTVVVASDPDTALASFDDFEVAAVRYDAAELEADLVLDGLSGERFPALTFSPATAPGAF